MKCLLFISKWNLEKIHSGGENMKFLRCNLKNDSTLSRAINILTVLGLWWVALGVDKIPGFKNPMNLI